MKTILTLDKANQPFGFPQLNSGGTFDNVISNVVSATTYLGLSQNYLPLSGGTVSGKTNFISGLTANQIGVNNNNPTFSLDVGTSIYSSTIDFIDGPYFGGTLDDATFEFSGYTGLVDYVEYYLNINSTGTPDIIYWSDSESNGGTFPIVSGVPQQLSSGVTVTFANSTGHAGDETWNVYVGYIISFDDSSDVINTSSQYNVKGKFFATQNRNKSVFLVEGVGVYSGVCNSFFVGENAGSYATGACYSNFLGNGAGFCATNAYSSNFLGPSAGSSATGASLSNFIGLGAGSSATNACFSNFLGQSAGSSATNACFSNFLGQSAGLCATGACYSNFLGQSAGSYATNARFSNFLGQSAGFCATNAYYSNFFGQNAGYCATNASNSNFLGQSAGFCATNAYYSNFLGGAAGFCATNAYFSNFLGVNAGLCATNAYYSNFFGQNAGYCATNASNSNFLGQSAGYCATNANSSNFLGYNVGSCFAGNNVGSNNIIIGTNISLPNATTNSINIGGVLFGANTYSATTGDPSIIPSTNGRIGIGVVNPQNTLHVSATTDPVRFDGLQITTTDTRVITTDSDGIIRYRNFSDFSGSTGSGTIGDYLPLSGGTVTGNTIFQSGLTANTISATTYQNLPEYTRRHDFSSPFSYNGYALSGSSESANVWRITRINVNVDGSTTKGTATNVSWTGRISHIYT